MQIALLALPDVVAASVLSCERPDGSHFLAAFVVASLKASQLDPLTVTVMLKHALRREGVAVPSVVRLLAALPLNASGKIDTNRLREILHDQSTAHSGSLSSPAEVSAFLCLQWAELVVKQVDPSAPDSPPHSLHYRNRVPDDAYFLIEGMTCAMALTPHWRCRLMCLYPLRAAGGSSLDALVLADRLAAAIGRDGDRAITQQLVQAVLSLPFARLVQFVVEGTRLSPHEDVCFMPGDRSDLTLFRSAKLRLCGRLRRGAAHQ